MGGAIEGLGLCVSEQKIPFSCWFSFPVFLTFPVFLSFPFSLDKALGNGGKIYLQTQADTSHLCPLLSGTWLLSTLILCHIVAK